MWKLTLMFPAGKKPKLSDLASIIDDVVHFNIEEIPDTGEPVNSSAMTIVRDVAASMVPSVEITKHDEKSEHANNDIPRPIESDIQAEGASAYEDGGDLEEDNPYEYNSKEYHCWRRGFLEPWGVGT